MANEKVKNGRTDTLVKRFTYEKKDSSYQITKTMEILPFYLRRRYVKYYFIEVQACSFFTEVV